MTDRQWQADWDRLRAERADARRRLALAAGAISERARDPIGMKETVRKHPFLVTGISAAVGALLARMLFGGGRRRRPRREDEDDEADEAPPPGPSIWGAALRNAAVGIATPWVTDFLQAKLAQFFDKDGDATPEQPSDPAQSPDPTGVDA